jgi:hypothetical protein
MKITVQITVQSDEGQAEVVQEVAHLKRGRLRPETLGLSLAEGGEAFPVDCRPSGNGWSESAAPFVIGLDGAYVHAKGQRSRAEGWFEVIVGKSIVPQDQASRCFGFVSRLPA